MLKARSNSVSAVFFFYNSREKRSKVKVNLPDFRRFAVIGLAAERNVALG